MTVGQAHIVLDGNRYMLREISPGILIQREQLPIFPPTQTVAPERVSRNSLTPIWGQDDFSGGIGLATAGVLDPTKRNRIWWAEGIDTRWSRYIELATISESESHAASADHIKKYVNWNGDLWGVFEGDFIATNNNDEVYIRKYGATSDDWTGGSTLTTYSSWANAHGRRAFDAIVHKGLLYVATSGNIGADTEVSYEIQSTVDGTNWVDRSGVSWPTNSYLTTTVTRRNNWDDDFVRLLDWGNYIVAAIKLDPDGAGSGGLTDIQIGYSTDRGANWTFNTGLQIPSGGGPKALVSWYDRAGVNRPLLFLQEGIFGLNISANTYEKLHSFTGDSNDGRRADVGDDGHLYVPLGNGDHIRISIGPQIQDGQVAWEITNIGPATVANFRPSDGLPLAYRGFGKFILPSQRGLYVAYGGQAASRNATILFFDYETGAWHNFYNHATANLDLYMLGLSSEDDNVGRLHAAVEGASASTMFMFEQPNVPHWISVGKTIQTGIVQLPYLHFDADGLAKAFLRVVARVDDLTAAATPTTTAEYITVKYGADGAARTTTTLGNLISGTKQLDVASGAGVSIADVGIELSFFRGTSDTTDTPKLSSINVLYDVGRGELEAHEFVIDVEATAAQERKSTKNVISELETTRNKAVLVAYQEPRLATAIYVRVLVPQWFDSYPMDALSAGPPGRSGFAKVRVERRLA